MANLVIDEIEDVSYIIKDGVRTHAVVLIEDWVLLNAEISIARSDIISYPKKHIENTIDFLYSIRDLSIDEWKDAYQEYFNYYESLDIEDIMALYLYRSGNFSTIVDKNVDYIQKKGSNELKEKFWEPAHIEKKDGSKFDWETYTKIRKKIGTSSEQEFLEFFHSVVKFKYKIIDWYQHCYKRIHRNSERDRLFVYDINILLANNYIDTSKKSIIKELKMDEAKYLANHLYNGNVSQVYRATKEAQKRIDSLSIN